MTRKWTNNILTKSFDINSTNGFHQDDRVKIVSFTKPIGAFFEKLGFKNSQSREFTAHLWVNSKSRLRLIAEPENIENGIDGSFDAIRISLKFKNPVNVTEVHPMIIRVSLNDKGGGKYELMDATNGKVHHATGDPRKIAEEFIIQSQGEMFDTLLSYANRNDRAWTGLQHVYPRAPQ